MVQQSIKKNCQGFLTTYHVRYPHAVPFLRNEMPYSLLKIPKKTCCLQGCSILNVLNLVKWGVKIPDCALLWDFLTLFWSYRTHPLLSRIGPACIIPLVWGSHLSLGCFWLKFNITNIWHELAASSMLKILVWVTQMNYMIKDLPKNSEVS